MKLFNRLFLAAAALGMTSTAAAMEMLKELDPQRPRSGRRPLTFRRLRWKSITQIAKLARRITRGRSVGCTLGDLRLELQRRQALPA